AATELSSFLSPMVGAALPFPLAVDASVSLACCKVGLDRPLIPAAFAANLFRSARVSRPRRSADGRSPGNGPTVGDRGCRGRASPDTVPEPAWRRQPQVTAMGQSNPLPRTPHGQWSVRRQRFGVNPPGLGRAGDEFSYLTWGLCHQPTICLPTRDLAERREITLHASRPTPSVARAWSESSKAHA